MQDTTLGGECGRPLWVSNMKWTETGGGSSTSPTAEKLSASDAVSEAATSARARGAGVVATVSRYVACDRRTGLASAIGLTDEKR